MARKNRDAKEILTQLPEHTLPSWANPESQNTGKSIISRSILSYYYYARFNSVVDLIKDQSGECLYALDIGCGVGSLLMLISNFCYDIVGLDCDIDSLKKIPSKYHVIRGYVPPLPFYNSAFDLVTAVNLTEHVPDEKLLVEEVYRVLRPNGVYICIIPVEIGVAGFIRHIVKNIAYPNRTDRRSIFDYSIEELAGKSPREKHGIGQKYYVYKYLLADLENIFNNIKVYSWPRYCPKFLAPVLYVKCTK